MHRAGEREQGKDGIPFRGGGHEPWGLPFLQGRRGWGTVHRERHGAAWEERDRSAAEKGWGESGGIKRPPTQVQEDTGNEPAGQGDEHTGCSGDSWPC